MNKILTLLAITAVLAGTSSCGGSDKSDPLGDSIATIDAKMQGYGLLQGFNQMPDDQRSQYDKDEVMRGFKDVMMLDSGQTSYMAGVQIGMQAWQQLTQLEKAGIKIDREKFYKTYAEAFLHDSVPAGLMDSLQMQDQAVQMRMQEKVMAKQKADYEAAQKAKANSPEAKANLKKGADYIAAQMAKDKSLVKTQSGLVYKVVAPGAGEKAGKGGSARLKYKGMHINGEVFDANESEFSPQGTVPGFGEAIAMMQKGGKYVLYIPGDLAYGLDGQPYANIGPNETLVFEIEAMEVHPANEPAPTEVAVPVK